MATALRSLNLPYQFHQDEYNLITQRDNGHDGGDTPARTGQYGQYAWIFKHKLKVEGLDSELFNDSLGTLQTDPGVIMRHPKQYPDVTDIPGDQLIPMIIAAGFYGYKSFIKAAVWNIVKNKGRYPNGNLLGPGDWAAILRALNAWYLYPVICVLDIFGELPNSLLISLWKGREPGAIRQWLGKHVSYVFIQDYKGDPKNPDSWSKHGKTNVGDDVRHQQHVVQARLRLPTPFSWLARKIYKWFRPSYQDGVSGPQYALNYYFRAETYANPFHVAGAEIVTAYIMK